MVGEVIAMNMYKFGNYICKLRENKNLTQTEYMRYKCCLPEDYDKFNQEHELFKKYTDDPNVVFDNCIVQVRSLYNGEERITKGKEFEHMIELHNAFIKNKENQ